MARRSRETSSCWVLVAGGFHADGGMDKLNAALARYLIDQGHAVHLVAFRIDDSFLLRHAAGTYLVAKPAGSFFLGRTRLDRRGRRVAAALKARGLRVRVVANGIGCTWPDINWVHFVNHAWPSRMMHGPRWLRLKSRIEARHTLRLERHVLPRARLLIANSRRTRADLLKYLQVPPDRIVTVYPGLESDWAPATAEERNRARSSLGISDPSPTILFVGALGFDRRKGFDTLWEAWRRLAGREDWRATLLVAGDGRALPHWRRIVSASEYGKRVRFLGFAPIAEVLPAADLLVSPTRYEPYGLNVHEAICRGVPALVSADAGVAERFPPSLRPCLLASPDDPDEIARRLVEWSGRGDDCRRLFAPLSRALRDHTADAMARQIVEAVTESSDGKWRELNDRRAV